MGLGTVFVIGITTSRMIMPGMPAIPQALDMKMMDLSAPTKMLTMHLTSEKKVDKQSKAECAVPEGLKLGPKVDLHISLPSAETNYESLDTDSGEPGESTKFVMKIYWSCGEKVPAGQPKVFDSDNLMSGKDTLPEDVKRERKSIQRAMIYADKSYAYWPGPDSKRIQPDSATPGLFTLTTNYCGGTSIKLDESQDFLAAVDLVSPKGKIDLEQTIKVEWKAVPNAVAYLLTASAGDAKQLVMWTSSADPDNYADLQGRALTKQQIETLLENGVLLPPTKTNCRIPAGIFKDVGNPMITVTAFGTDKIQTKDGIETQVIVRSNTSTTPGLFNAETMTAEDQAADESEEQASDESVVDAKPTVKQASDKEPAKDEQAASDDRKNNEIADAAKDEANEQTKETVRDTVRKVFGKLRKK